MAEKDSTLRIGAIVFPEMDQIDLTGPLEVLSRIPGATFNLCWKELAPVRDVKGFTITPDTRFGEAPDFDLLVVPGGWGQEKLMDDEEVLGFIRNHAARGRVVFSVCTGALLCGAAGILRSVKSTTHWASHHLLPYFGAIAVNARVDRDRNHISAAGVTSGIDGALEVAAFLRGDEIAQQIQLQLEYAPEPPFASGTPDSAPPEVLEAVRRTLGPISDARLATAKRCARRLGIV